MGERWMFAWMSDVGVGCVEVRWDALVGWGGVGCVVEGLCDEVGLLPYRHCKDTEIILFTFRETGNVL
jgi:hypothetical protein